MRDKSAFDVEKAILDDFACALDRLDPAQLRAFLRQAVKRDRPGQDSLALAFVEFAARNLGVEAWGEDDPDLGDDVEQWLRSVKKKGKVDVSETRTFLLRARRQLLLGRASSAHRAYEVILGLLAELEAAYAAGDVTAPDLVAPAVFGSYLVSAYEDAPAAERVDRVLDAVELVAALGTITAPLALLEESRVRPLDGFADFTRAWARELEARCDRDKTAGSGDTAFDPTEPLAEALEKLEGLEGVARMARRARDLSHYRTYVSRLAEQSQWSAALAIVDEADGALADGFGRGVILDIGVTLALRSEDTARAVELAERAFMAHATMARLARWLLLDEPDRERLSTRVQRAAEVEVLDPRMQALLCAIQGAFGDVAALLDAADDHWEDEGHPGRVAFPALLVAFYGGPRGTPIAAKVCAPLFGVRPRPNETHAEPWYGWEPSADALGNPTTPSPGPAIVAVLHELDGSREHAEHLETLPTVLRDAAARRAALVLARKERNAYDAAAMLIVAAAEATFRAGDQDLARTYLADVAQAATRHSAFRGALTRTLAKSALVNAL